MEPDAFDATLNCCARNFRRDRRMCDNHDRIDDAGHRANIGIAGLPLNFCSVRVDRDDAMTCIAKPAKNCIGWSRARPGDASHDDAIAIEEGRYGWGHVRHVIDL